MTSTARDVTALPPPHERALAPLQRTVRPRPLIVLHAVEHTSTLNFRSTSRATPSHPPRRRGRVHVARADPRRRRASHTPTGKSRAHMRRSRLHLAPLPAAPVGTSSCCPYWLGPGPGPGILLAIAELARPVRADPSFTRPWSILQPLVVHA